MASSPPASPGTLPQRPLSAMVRPAPRSNSRMSMNSKAGGGSRASDEDGRTSVKVAVRVRPPLRPTDPGFDLIPQRFQRSMVQVTSNTSLAIDAPQGRKLFVFDRVFGPDVNQEGIWEYVEDCVGAFVQGYNVSLLAYGQSGAGKSYTMGTSGPAEQGDLEMMGVIPRAASALFEKLEGPPPSNKSNRNSMSQLRTPARYSSQAPTPKGERNWTLKATYVEIYNEHLRDLLIPEHVPASERGAVTIREDVKGNILLTGLRQVEINSVDDLLNALNFGSTIRQTDATAINAKSSRSHAVFSLNLVQRKSSSAKSGQGSEKRFSVPLEAMTGTESWITTDSKLHFVDLAGSERLKNTGAHGERAKEGISINAGLAALGKVISQLSSRQPGSHVSYRDSRLTRLLQDSLGGNAITYMIACVTPAEFHLSETLNTVQYAQRARAIQSKPRIQQVEEGDKQAIIDRLKAEVAFLREQIRSAERGGGDGRRVLASSERSERNNELQNQLLETQESYTALSQRHAKLIAEMAKARDAEMAESEQHEHSLGDSATARLNRSNSFAQAVEQVVLEYEKTIQSLEQSLSSTRTTLSNTETSLLEKETKCAYNDTINSQLQARLQKMMDREASTENYLHDLEAKLDGHTSGEEKNATIILELRKEIARVRENEAACEDYISTLEERLAEADQDAELMQREIDRLEQVVERQRSLGKLDSLLYELDHIQHDGVKPHADFSDSGSLHRRDLADHSRSQSHASRQSHKDVIHESSEEDVEEQPPPPQQQQQQPTLAVATPVEDAAEEEKEHGEADSDAGERTLAAVAIPALDATPRPSLKRVDPTEYPPQSPAQSKFVADKLENVTQELIDLRVEHETTINEFDVLHAKYEEALRTLAELQDAVDEARHPSRARDSLLSVTSPTQTRPSSFLSDAKDGGQHSSSRSLSSELSSAMESPATVDTSDAETAKPTDLDDAPKVNGTSTPPPSLPSSDTLAVELERLKALAASKESAEKELAEKYAELEQQHQDTLDIVEELKTEVAKAKTVEATSPRGATPVIRRKSSQNVMIIDRAHRSFAALRNIAADNFEGNPDVMQNFEINLNAAMHELHARSERVQELEADVTSAKKEMETKMTIINGLTRERSSLKSSPLDMSVVSTLKDQLEKNDSQLRALQEAHERRELELVAELEKLRVAKEASGDASPAQTDVAARAANDKKIAELESELANWETKHQTALDSMAATEQQMKKTIGELEAQVTLVDARVADTDSSRTLEARELESKQETLMAFLRSEIDEYKAVINGNVAKIADLEQAHSSAKAQLTEMTRERALATTESSGHRDLVRKLESQISDHEEALKTHHESLRQLQADHDGEVAEIKAAAQADAEEQIRALAAEHAESIKALEGELTEAKEDLMKIATQVAFAVGLDVSVEKITERIDDLVADQKALSEEQGKRAELQRHVGDITTINDNIMRDLEAVKSTLNELLVAENSAGDQANSYPSVTEQLGALRKRMADLASKNEKNSRLVEQLEDQLQSNFDQVQVANNRVSTLQSERNAKIEEANSVRLKTQAELDLLREDYANLQAKLEEMIPNGDHGPKRSNSVNSHLRKSASVASLPSPPPSMPLPPLPANATSASPTNAGGVPATPTQGVRPASKDNMAMTQIQEDQEARIRTIEKHLFAERQLTSTLEEALTDLERQSNKVKADCDQWRRRCQELETEIKDLKDRPQEENRWSIHQVEEERKKRRDAELAARHLEERMNAISKKNKKKASLNCF